MDAESLVLRYQERLAWSSDEARSILAKFIDDRELLDGLKEFLVDETGLDLADGGDGIGYRGHPFCVLAYGGDSGTNRPEERIDTESEVLALEAFSELLSRPDLDRFVVIQFRSNAGDSRELLHYDRRASVQEW